MFELLASQSLHRIEYQVSASAPGKPISGREERPRDAAKMCFVLQGMLVAADIQQSFPNL